MGMSRYSAGFSGVVHEAEKCEDCANEPQLLTFESADEVGAAMAHIRLQRCPECTTPDELVDLLADD
jgi:hypothetical protein